MSLRVSFELSNTDLKHFRTIMREARDSAAQKPPAEVFAAARKLLESVDGIDIPEFVSDRLARIQVMIDMVEDQEWALPASDAARVTSALAYFGEPEDLIPDHIPGLGFLDDAIMVELVVRELRHEIDAYADFCRYREVEERKRGGRDAEDPTSREAWLAGRRKELQSRMRNRRLRERTRRGASSGGRSPFSLF
ncbi:MAG: YkvA family protein [Gammaproteobacteria bacterium]